MKRNLLNLKSLFLTLAVLANASCSFDITKIHPHFLDVSKGYARVYRAEKIKPEQCGDPDYEFVFTGEKKPIAEMSGYACIPVEEVQELLKHYDEHKRKQCPNEFRADEYPLR